MQINSNYTDKVAFRSTAGFTLFELLIVVGVIGILSAITLPAWFGFIERQRLNTAQDEIYRAIQAAKSYAKLEKLTWQFSIKKTDNVVQWAVHSPTVNSANIQWHNLDQEIDLDPETTLQKSGSVRRIQFDFQGNVTQPPLGRVTLSSRHGGKTKRCVFVSTLIGTLRTAKERPYPNRKDGKYCY